MEFTLADVLTVIGAITGPACGFLSVWIRRLYADLQFLHREVAEERSRWLQQLAKERGEWADRHEALLREVLGALQEDQQR